MPASPLPPSPKMYEMAAVIVQRTKQAGFPPTLTEIATDMGVSLSYTHALVTKAKERGLVTVEPRQARTLRVVGKLPRA